MTEPKPKTNAGYQAFVAQRFADMNRFEEKTGYNAAESERMRAEAQRSKTETDILKAEIAVVKAITKTALFQLMQ